jgi:predicted MFS family arabinose efflux permease
MTGARPAPPARSRGLWLLLAHAVLVQLISYGLRPAISYEILSLDLDAAWLGVATASFALPPLLLALPAGRVVDRLGERGMLIAGGATLAAAAGVALAFPASPAGLIVATALLGLGVLFSVVGEQTWVMRGAPNDRLDFSFGLYTFATSTGQMLGPLLLLLPSPGAGAPPLGAVATVTLALGAAALLLSFGIPSTLGAVLPGRRGTGDAADVPTGRSAGAFALVRQPGVPSALLASSIVLTSLDILIAYLPLLAEERGISAAWVSVMLVARGAATMLSRVCLSLLTRQFGRRAVLISGGLVAAVSLGLLAVPLPPLALTGLIALYGLAAGTVQPLTMSWMTLITPPAQRGLAASLRLVGNRIGQTTIPLAVAAVSTAGGATAVFLLMGGGLIASSAMSRAAPNDAGPAR